MQSEACSYTEGPLLILAGAGSGKTRVITHRIAYLINEQNVNPYNILAITFTNKAATEMRERVNNIVGKNAGYIWVSTFHSLCARILRRYYDHISGYKSFNIYDTEDQKTVIKDVLKKLDLDPKKYSEKYCISEISKAKEEFLKPEDIMRMAGTDYRKINVANIYIEYQKKMKLNHALDFDDLIFCTIELFDKDPLVLKEYQERFKYIMVDEYQDTNDSQFILIKKLAEKYRNICVVGDEDQSIYKFRGADIYNILNFEKIYPEAKAIKLEQNYRSTKNILAAANSVISENSNRNPKKLWTSNETGERIVYTTYSDEYMEASGAVNEIEELVQKDVLPNDIAILYRTNNQSRVLEEKLVYAGVKYKIVGGTNFYQRKEIKDLICYLKCISNPADNVAFSRIINVPKRGIGATTINNLKNKSDAAGTNMYNFCLDYGNEKNLGRSYLKIKEFIEMMEEFRKKSESGELIELFDDILEKTKYKLLLEQEQTDEAKTRIGNIDELKNKIAKYEMDTEEPNLVDLLEQIALVADRDNENDAGGSITLMTLHSAKGLEFSYVFIVGMEDGLFPSRISLNSGDPDDVEEERRLCYVGITRARKKLYLSNASSRMINGTRDFLAPSRFLDSIPDELLEKKGEAEFGSCFESSYGRKSGTEYDRYKTDSSNHSKLNEFVENGAAYKVSQNNCRGNSWKKDNMSLDNIPGLSRGIHVSDTNSYEYEVGDRVRHLKFGKGTVIKKNPMGSDYEVTVDFENSGEKRMFASLAKLKKI